MLSAGLLPGTALAQTTPAQTTPAQTTPAPAVTPAKSDPTQAKLPNLPLSITPNAELLSLSDEGILKAFPSGHRPEAVLLSGDAKVTISFDWRDTKLSSADVPVMLTRFPAVIKAQVPGIKSIKQQIMTLNGTNWADFIFVAPGKSGDVRREMMITSAQGRMLVLTISSNLADYPKNEAAVRALTSSIRLTE